MKKFQLYKEITLCSSPLLSVEATGLRKIVASLEEKINAEITLYAAQMPRNADSSELTHDDEAPHDNSGMEERRNFAREE